MKRVKETMRRLLALGITAVLIAGSIPQTAYAAETGDEPTAAALDVSVPESTEGASEDIEVIDASDEEASVDAPSGEEGKEPEEEPEATEEIERPEGEAASSTEGSSEDEEPGEEASLEDSEEVPEIEDEKDSKEKLFGANELTGIDKTIVGLGTHVISDPVYNLTTSETQNNPWRGSYGTHKF